MSRILTKYYQKRVETEWHRLDKYRMEFSITKRVLHDYLPSAPASIADIGGGPGKYAIYLTKHGYEITLVDIVKENIAYAKIKAREANVRLYNTITANAANLNMLPNCIFDAVLLMGPLYHLVSVKEQKIVLAEANRILRPEGVIIVSFISFYERLRFLAKYEPAYLALHKSQIYKLLKTGILRGSTKLANGMESFTTAYFTHPKDINKLMEDNGFSFQALHGVEVITGNPYDETTKLDDVKWKDWVDVSYWLSTDPYLLGASDHLLYVGKKQ